MNTRTMRAVSRKLTVCFVAFTLAGTLTGCAGNPKPPPVPSLTQLETRQLQTREYDSTNVTMVMKAVISSLQDGGFIIGGADAELGLVTAAMERPDEDTATKDYLTLWFGAGQGTYMTTRRLEASATVRDHGEVVRVRINIVAKALTNTGGILWSTPFYEPRIYQELFSKIDKALFIEKQKL